MKIKKEYIILAAVIAVLSFYLLKQKKGNIHYTLPELKKIDKKDISRLVIKKADSEITMLKKDDKWVISPQNFPAASGLAGKMEDEISSLTITDLVSESKNDAIYGLDKGKKVEVAAYKGDELLIKIEIGKPASSYRHTFVKVENDNRIFHAQGNLADIFDKRIQDLRDKTVMAFNGDEITEIHLTKGGKNLIVTRAPSSVSVDLNREKTEKKGAGQPKWAAGKGGPVNEKEIEDIIGALSKLSCESFIEGKAKNDFKNPRFSAVLKGTKEYSISIFEKEGNKYSAISSGTEYPFYVYEWDVNRFMKELEKITEKEKK